MTLEISKGDPKRAGIYVAYVDSDMLEAVIKERVILYWDGSTDWSYTSSDQKYRKKVYGWIGPLPPLKITKE